MDVAIAQERLLTSVRNNPDTGYGRAMLRHADVSTRMESARRAGCELFVGPVAPGPPGRSELRQPSVHRPRSARIDRRGGERLSPPRA
jgi:hypothetical protein